MRRRQFLCGLAAAGVATLAPRPSTTPRLPSITAFTRWLHAQQPPTGRGLVSYFGAGPGHHPPALSPLASANALMFWLKIGAVAPALRVANGLVSWQRQLAATVPRRVRGGFPSTLTLRHQRWRPGAYYYSGENLAVVAALVRAYQELGIGAHAEAALKTAHWLRHTLFDGVRLGVTRRNYGAPLMAMTSGGAVLSRIGTGTSWLWLRALRLLAQIDPGAGWDALGAQGHRFLLRGQSAYGCWYDHFRPGQGEQPGRWCWYGHNPGAPIVLADTGLRAALAAGLAGDRHAVARFQRWLRPADGVYLWGYLDARNCRPAFLPQNTPYYDIVCTGLMRSLFHLVGEAHAAERCRSALGPLQSADGGWYWGRVAQTLAPLNAEQATLTGIWAVSDPTD